MAVTEKEDFRHFSVKNRASGFVQNVVISSPAPVGGIQMPEGVVHRGIAVLPGAAKEAPALGKGELIVSADTATLDNQPAKLNNRELLTAAANGELELDQEQGTGQQIPIPGQKAAPLRDKLRQAAQGGPKRTRTPKAKPAALVVNEAIFNELVESTKGKTNPPADSDGLGLGTGGDGDGEEFGLGDNDGDELDLGGDGGQQGAPLQTDDELDPEKNDGPTL